MAFSISGRVAEGMDDALAQVLDRRLKEATRQQIERQNAAENMMRQQGIDLQRETLAGAKEDRVADNARQQQVVDLQLRKDTQAQAEKATQANRASDMAGVMAMPGMAVPDKVREISGLALKSGADPLKVIANLQPKPNQQSYTYTDPVTQKQELRFFDKNTPQTGLDMGKHVPQSSAGQETPVKLTPAGLDIAALNFFKTGNMPTLGMRDVNRQNIINRAAELTPADRARIEGMVDIAGNKQAFAADTKSLGALQQQRDAVGAFEATASKNIDVFLKQAEKVVDSGSPLINTPLRSIAGSVFGSKDQAAYEAARQVAVNEIAKITTSPTMGGQLSDAARKEVAAFSPANATLGQTVAVLRLLKTEMQNRITTYDDQIKEIKSRSKTKPDDGGDGGNQPPPKSRYQLYLDSLNPKPPGD